MEIVAERVPGVTTEDVEVRIGQFGSDLREQGFTVRANEDGTPGFRANEPGGLVVVVVVMRTAELPPRPAWDGASVELRSVGHREWDRPHPDDVVIARPTADGLAALERLGRRAS